MKKSVSEKLSRIQFAERVDSSCRLCWYAKFVWEPFWDSRISGIEPNIGPLSKAQSKQAEESLTGVRIKFIWLGTFMVAEFVTRPSTVQFRI